MRFSTDFVAPSYKRVYCSCRFCVFNDQNKVILPLNILLMSIGISPLGDALPPSRQKPTPVAPLVMTTSYSPGPTCTAGRKEVGEMVEGDRGISRGLRGDRLSRSSSEEYD